MSMELCGPWVWVRPQIRLNRAIKAHLCIQELDSNKQTKNPQPTTQIYIKFMKLHGTHTRSIQIMQRPGLVPK